MTTAFSWKMALERQVRLLKKGEARCSKNGDMPHAIEFKHRCDKLKQRIKDYGL